MKGGGTTRGLAILVVVELVLFLVSLPGFGLETRSFTQYSAWAGPVFLGLTLLIFVSGIACLLSLSKRPGASARLAGLLAIAAIITVALDTSHVGGPPPPPGPFWLGIVAAVFAVGIICLAWRLSQRSDAGRSRLEGPNPA